MKALRPLAPGATFSCLGGPLLRGAGAEVVVPNHDLAVVGVIEVLPHLRTIVRAWRRLKEHLEAVRPDVVVLIDFPDFNFVLARLAKRLGLKIFYYISPQVWAWRQGRVRTLKRLVDRMAVILPFEEAFYRRHGMNVDYVGHPLLDVMAGAPSREKARSRYRPAGEGPLVGLLPGSRRAERDKFLPLLLATASLIARQVPGVSFIIPVAPTLDEASFRSATAGFGVPLQLIKGDAHGVMAASDLILTASGTVTLEAAILETPMVLFYKIAPLTYPLARRLVKAPWVGLPNLIAGHSIVPELIQDEATPARLAAEAVALLRHPQRLEAQREELSRIGEQLGIPGVSERVARLVLKTAGFDLGAEAVSRPRAFAV